MPALQWSNSYSVGLAELDEDHKQIVDMIAELSGLAEAGPAGCPESLFLTRFDCLIASFAAHTAREERYLGRLRSPAGIAHCAEHRASHDRFREEAEKVRDQIANGTLAPESVGELGVFLMLFELIRIDYDLVGLLRREGLLIGEGEIVEA